jgi:hypothetical protein
MKTPLFIAWEPSMGLPWLGNLDLEKKKTPAAGFCRRGPLLSRI